MVLEKPHCGNCLVPFINNTILFSVVNLSIASLKSSESTAATRTAAASRERGEARHSSVADSMGYLHAVCVLGAVCCSQWPTG